MRDTLLEYSILRALPIDASPIHQTALASEIEISVGHHELTYNDFIDNLHRLMDLGLIAKSKDLLNYTRWALTEKGKSALSEINGTMHGALDDKAAVK